MLDLLLFSTLRITQIADAPSPRSKPLSKNARAAIEKALSETKKLLRETAGQLFLAIKEHIYAILDQMHSAGYERKSGAVLQVEHVRALGRTLWPYSGCMRAPSPNKAPSTVEDAATPHPHYHHFRLWLQLLGTRC